ncbi:hypothetical protein RBH26_20915 [Natronolimnohabitans sp. A-GB9]|uniref:hypothetical protein n=1 Tax=Natronolimnohabitans sp. A-GB9 TaxID=3069757 RepID=UPI0027B1716F|nr:hypothetical protein [Natronolimnohabitans sp. A-GB9]MDQ2052907.1 hypothetical protein [Natronolimnohabitans sp. A-GB9]
MSDSESDSNSGKIEAFTDTSVLFNFALDVRQQRADELLRHHECSIVASDTVKREFEKVMERRQQIHTQLLPYIKRDEIGEFEPDNSEELTSNDWGYIRNFQSTLTELGPAEAARRVQERNRQLKQGYRELFELDTPHVILVQIPSRDASLLGSLSGVIENDADARILCDAVEWVRDSGSGIFITSDVDDMLSDSDTTEEASEENGGLSDSFEGFLSGDSRPAPERINDAIKQRYDESCCLDIHSIDTFLDQY